MNPSLKPLVDIAKAYIDVTADTYNHRMLTDDLLKISGASYVVFNIYNPDRGTTTTASISGINSNILKATQLFGFELIGKEWEDIEDEQTRSALASKNLVCGGNVASYSKYIPPVIGTVLNTVFNVGDIYSIGVYKNNILMGNFQLIMQNKAKIDDSDVVEIFAGMAGNLLSRLESQKLIEDERRKLKVISEYSPDLLIIADKNRKIVFMNKVLPGFQMEKVIGDNVLNYVADENKTVYTAWLDEVFSKGISVNGQVKAVGANHADAYYEVSFVPVKIENEIINAYIVARDVTARKNIENKLSESKEQYTLLFENSYDAVLLTKQDGSIVRANPAAIKMFGKSEQDIIKGGRNALLDLSDPRLPVLLEYRKKFGHARGELGFIGKDGLVFQADVSSRVFMDQEGVEMTSMIIRDISERIKNEEVIRTNEERLHHALEGVGDGIWDWDIEKNTVYYSPSWEAMFGFEKGSVPQTLDIMSKQTHPDDIDTMFSKVNSFLKKEIPVYKHSFRMFHKNGTLIWTQHRAIALYDDSGKPMRMIGATQDITDFKRNQEELQLAKERADLNATIKEIFLAIMSHEMRTPLNAIIGFSSLLSQTNLNDVQNEYLNTINLAGEHLMDVIGNIIDFSKIESDSIVLAKEPVRIADVINEVSSILSHRAAEKRIRFNASVSSAIPEWVLTDTLRFKQVLINLLGNAIKFTDSGFVNITVAPANSEEQRGVVEFVVRDSGIGIPLEMHGNIFERFVQSDSAIGRQYEGSGLGLAIVKKLVELFNGTIHLESEVGKGSIFLVRIPFEIAEAPVARIDKKVSSHKRRIAIKNPKVLLVEDNMLNQKLVLEVFKKYALSVDVAGNGVLAVDMLGKKGYDLILMDLHMPLMDGISAAKVIRTQLKLDTPIVAITADVSVRQKDECFKAGMNEYLLKPFKEEDLKQLFVKYGLSLDVKKDQKKYIKILPKIKQGDAVSALYDLSYLNKASGNNDVFIKEAIELFIVETSNDLKNAAECARKNNLSEVKELVHKLKASYSFFRMNALVVLCDRIKLSDNLMEVNNTVYELTSSTHKVIDVLREEYS
jgi:PAS domain S-box-containing protein